MNSWTQSTYTLHLHVLPLPYTYCGSPGFISFNPGAPFPTILPLTLGNETEEVELQWQAEQVVYEWDPEVFLALSILFIEPEVAAEYGPIYHLYNKKMEVSGIPGL